MCGRPPDDRRRGGRTILRRPGAATGWPRSPLRLTAALGGVLLIGGVAGGESVLPAAHALAARPAAVRLAVPPGSGLDSAAPAPPAATLRPELEQLIRRTWAGARPAASRGAGRPERVALAVPDAAGLAPSPQARAALRFALARRGLPYLWGGVGPNAYDCSGLTQAAYRSAGIAIPRVAADQARVGTAVRLADLLPGDLVFYAYDVRDLTTIHHVAMYVGGGLVVHAPQTGDVVRISPMWLDGYAGAVRISPAVPGRGLTDLGVLPASPPPADGSAPDPITLPEPLRPPPVLPAGARPPAGRSGGAGAPTPKPSGDPTTAPPDALHGDPPTSTGSPTPTGTPSAPATDPTATPTADPDPTGDPAPTADPGTPAPPGSSAPPAPPTTPPPTTPPSTPPSTPPTTPPSTPPPAQPPPSATTHAPTPTPPATPRPNTSGTAGPGSASR